jgi:hypothetical protein
VGGKGERSREREKRGGRKGMRRGEEGGTYIYAAESGQPQKEHTCKAHSWAIIPHLHQS